MGADIRAVVEVDRHTVFLSPIGIGYFEWPRCTNLFRALGLGSDGSAVPQRGFPEYRSHLALRQYAVPVCPNGERLDFLPDVVEQHEAEDLVRSGDSRWIDNASGGLGCGYVSKPCAEYANWITLEELQTAVQSTQQSNGSEARGLSFECQSTISFMEMLQTPETVVRLVYWFDV